ncbi:hypothetical protein OIO90_001712 [Microbotryomycetes sp. JL221]|nr:hypothetical protein OIO90_001712 [Microbotryomycetes sp. JL221]
MRADGHFGLDKGSLASSDNSSNTRQLESTTQSMGQHANQSLGLLTSANPQETSQLEADLASKRRSVEAKQAELTELDRMLAAANEREQQLKAMLSGNVNR